MGFYNRVVSLFTSSSGDLGATATAVIQEHHARLSRYTKYWRLYHGMHWDWTPKDGEQHETVNLSRRFADKHAGFLMKRGFKVVVPDDPATQQDETDEREFVRLKLEEAWLRNKRPSWCIEAGQMGGVSGDLFCRVSWEQDDPLFPPYARVDILPSRYVFPDFGGPAGVDRKKVNSVLLLFPRYRDQEAATGLETIKAKAVEWYAERWYAARTDPETGEKIPAYVEYMATGQDTKEEPNPLGEIPIVHIPNFPVAGEFFGKSDLADLDGLQKTINETMTDIRDVINYHGSPVTILKGAKLRALDRGANRVWAIPADADVRNLKLDGDLDASIQFLEIAKRYLHEVGAVPEIATAPKQISHESAVSQVLQYLPLLDVRDVKVAVYGIGLRLINRLMLKVTALKDPEFGRKLDALPIDTRYLTDIKFGEPLPRDEARELDKAEKRIELRLTDRKWEQEKTLGLSQGEITQIDKGIAKDVALEADAELTFGQRFVQERSGNPDPDRPSPEMQGEARSAAAEPDIG